MKLNLGSGKHLLEGFDNLDKLSGWQFEYGLPCEDSTVDAITLSHMLMYVGLGDWPACFAEMHRVLAEGGVVRITEEDTENAASNTYGGRNRHVTLTSPRIVIDHLVSAGFRIAAHVLPTATLFRDDTLIQHWHGSPPHVFHAEGVK